jgi:Tat protein secretion system quality control protein TatD with DNase activity
VVALGEAGLDYFYDNGSPEAQARGFRAHIAAARATGLPLVIHTREADADCQRILEEEVAKVLADTRGVSLEEISRQTTENFFRLFSKVPAPVAA